MTEDKPIAKPIIDDATREKMALMFSGEVYLPDDVDGFFDLQAAQRDLQLELNATPLTNPKRRTELMQAFFGAAGEGLYLECPVYANWGCNTYWGERVTPTQPTLVDDGEIFIGSHTMIGPNVTLVATGHPCVRTCAIRVPSIRCPSTSARTSGSARMSPCCPGSPSGTTRSLAPTRWSPRTSPPTRSPMAARAKVIREINERDDVYYWRDRQFSERFKLKEQ